MNKIELAPTDELPYVKFDSELGYLEISGRSFPQDVNKFYGPLLHWIREYGKHPFKSTLFKCNIEYFNTSSQKFLAEILKELNKIHKSHAAVKVEWMYNSDDEDLMTIGKEFEKFLDLRFDYKSI